MQNASTSPSLLDRMAQGAGRAREAFASAMSQDTQRRHDLRMKHGYPLQGDTLPTLLRCAAAVLIAATLAGADVLITAMAVYQDHVITFVNTLE